MSAKKKVINIGRIKDSDLKVRRTSVRPTIPMKSKSDYDRKKIKKDILNIKKNLY